MSGRLCRNSKFEIAIKPRCDRESRTSSLAASFSSWQRRGRSRRGWTSSPSVFFFFFLAERSVAPRLDFFSILSFFFFFLAAERSVAPRLDFSPSCPSSFSSWRRRGRSRRALDFFSLRVLLLFLLGGQFVAFDDAIDRWGRERGQAHRGEEAERDGDSSNLAHCVCPLGSIHLWRELTAFLSRGFFDSELPPNQRHLIS